MAQPAPPVSGNLGGILIRRLSTIVDAARSALPPGTTAVAIGVVLNGLASYAFLVLPAFTGRLDAASYAELSTTWFLLVTVVNGCLLPAEQSVTQLVATRRASGAGTVPVIRAAAGRVVVIAAVTSACIVMIPVITGVDLGSGWLRVALVGSTFTFAVLALAKGLAAGSAEFTVYARLVAGDGLVRVGLAAVIVVAGARTATPYGWAIAITPAVVIVTTGPALARLLGPGGPLDRRKLDRAIRHLLAGALSSQLLANTSPIIATALASASERELAGRLGAAFVLTRTPLFLFQAVQTSLLSRLSTLIAQRRIIEARRVLGRILGALGVVVAASVVAAATVGPLAIRTLFGPEFGIGGGDIALLTAGSGGFLVATSIAQVLIASGTERWVSIGWLSGLAVFGATVWVVDDLLLRIELGFAAGSATAVVMMGVVAREVLARRHDAGARPIDESGNRPDGLDGSGGPAGSDRIDG